MCSKEEHTVGAGMRDTFRPEKHFPENGGTSKPPQRGRPWWSQQCMLPSSLIYLSTATQALLSYV